MPSVSYLLLHLGPTSSCFHHLSIVPPVVDQAFNAFHIQTIREGFFSRVKKSPCVQVTVPITGSVDAEMGSG
jgi:hypothetical protein